MVEGVNFHYITLIGSLLEAKNLHSQTTHKLSSTRALFWYMFRLVEFLTPNLGSRWKLIGSVILSAWSLESGT